MLKRKSIFQGVVTFYFLLNTAYAQITTLDITQSTLTSIPNCIDYQPKGFCVWQYNNPMPEIMTTPYVSHYLPDAVVSVFAHTDNNPWVEANESYDKAAFLSGDSATQLLTGYPMAQGQLQAKHLSYNKLTLREVDVIGNPVLVSDTFLDLFPFLLQSQAKPMMPYYLSMADNILWRSAELDIDKLVSGFLPENEITNAWPLYTWGGLYPRTGYSSQSNIAKASFKVALRGLSIATSNNAHLHQNFDKNTCGTYCQGAGEAKPNSDKTLWQRVYPNPETSCQTLPDAENPEWTQGELNEGFVWVAWRYYEGCVEGQGKVIEVVKW